MQHLQGAWPTMVTPIDTDFKIDRAGYRALVEWYIAHQAGGMYANCATSEMDILTEDEQLVLVEEAVAVSNGRTPVAATGNTGETIEAQVGLCRRVADAGADIVMLVVPPGVEKDEDMERYFMTFVEQVDAPLGIYEWPVPGMKHLSLDLVRKLAATGRFMAYKETSCNLDKLRALLQITDATPLALLQANAPYLLPFIKAGGHGTMSIACALVPDLVSAVIKAVQTEDDSAESLHQMLCVIDLVQRSGHPCVTKYMLQKRGVPMASRTRRTPNDLPAEQRYALDYVAGQWFDGQGELHILS